MPHNGSTVACNAPLRGEGYASPGQYCNVFDAAQQGPFTIRNASTLSEWTGDPTAYVDFSTPSATFLQPPTGNVWGSTWTAIWGNNEQRWIVTWTGTANPDVTVENFFGPGTIAHVPAESSANRKVFKITGVNPVLFSDGLNWSGKSGLNGIVYAIRIVFRNQTGPITNLKMYRLEDEPRVLQGKRFTQKYIDACKVFGMHRHMDTMDVNNVPNIADPAQVAPASCTPTFSRLYTGGSDLTQTATLISPNCWQVTARSGKPAPTHGMGLRFAIPAAPTTMDAVVVSKGAVTELSVPGHGLTTGDVIQHMIIYGFSGTPVAGIGWPEPFLRGARDATTKQFDAFPVTVLDADRFTIPYDSSSNNITMVDGVWVSGQHVHVGGKYRFFRPMRVRYGGADYYLSDGSGRWGVNDWSYILNPPWSGKPINGYFVIPPGRSATDGWFAAGSAWQMHPSDIVELSNECGAHVHICMPLLASNELYDFYANYLHANLDPDLKVWWESGNEVWNFPGPQSTLNNYASYAIPSGSWPQGCGYRTRSMMQRVKAVVQGTFRTFHGFIQVQEAGWMLAVERGFYDMADPNGTGTNRPIDFVDYIGGAPYYGQGISPPIETDYWAEGGDQSISTATPGWKEAVKAFKDDTRPWGQRTNGLQWFTDHLAANHTPLLIKRHSESASGSINEPGHIGNAAKRHNKRIMCYEGGNHTFPQWCWNGFDGSAAALGCTQDDVRAYLEAWRIWPGGQATHTITHWNAYFGANSRCEWPNQYTVWGKLAPPSLWSWGVITVYGQDWQSHPQPTLDAYAALAIPNSFTPGLFFVAGKPVTLTYTPAQAQPYYAMTKWNCFTRDLGLGVHNFTSHTFKVAFSLSTPQVSWTRLSDVPQIGTTGGYVTGGYAVTVTWSETAGIGILKIDDREITATSDGLSLRYAVLYNDTAANDPLIGFYDFGPVTMQETDVLNINFDEAQGALRVQ